MAPKPQKKKKIRDTVNYSSLDFNPLILDQSTLDKLNDDYDPALVDHRRRLAKCEDKNSFTTKYISYIFIAITAIIIFLSI